MNLRSTLCLPVLLLAGCADDPLGPSGDRVRLPGDTFYPEGVAFDRSGGMFVSSILTGQVVRVESGTSVATELVPPNVLGDQLLGLAMSQGGDLLWACLGTFGTGATPAVIGVDSETGAEVVRHHFPPQRDGSIGGLCNELTEDDAGNVYASDSLGARIVRIDAADRTTGDRAFVWAEGPELGASMFGVNGIAFDGDGAILAVNYETGTLHRISLDGAAIATVAIERPLAGPDGIRLDRSGRAIVVEQGAVAAIELGSGAIEVLHVGLQDPTSLDLLDGAAWVAEGQLRHIFDMTPPELPFEVVRVAL